MNFISSRNNSGRNPIGRPQSCGFNKTARWTMDMPGASLEGPSQPETGWMQQCILYNCSKYFINKCRVQKVKQENIFAIPFNSHYHFMDYQQGSNFKLSLKIASPNLYSLNFSIQCMNEQGTQNHNFTGFQFNLAMTIFTHPTHP